ncbi:MAG: hypothetical protein AAGA33_05710 [Pseudomonadota bacterium]
MQGRRNPFVAPEGVPLILGVGVAGWAAATWVHPGWSLLALVLMAVLYLVFRDPRRLVPSIPLGVVSPVDGVVEEVDLTDRGVSQGEAHRILIRVNPLGTYTARSPVEGRIRDLNALAADQIVDYRTNALWVQTDEGDDVVLQFRGYRFGLAPRAFIRYGERLGQGQRCAYLRLTRLAEVHLPIDSQIQCSKGDTVVAGSDVIARLPHP